ncbi:very short patch repair endonuclease [Adlercreutzia sp. R25]|uniref:Very short patch repair endonuclease n=1 Tax=Adlercreutzia shanghongiae TaxID=3111773 RepID=A0ABU6IZ08_9ACTN|nr:MULTISPECIES: very short patch repair endonuclease [unclassified Adlercreutzia]MEC4272776.1 very short patch repair endonuclease [Adlercreutzia sp. R25]MEC4295106.1 very short patch repair endonuclease [Adlercreutzia sp. R22]
MAKKDKQAEKIAKTEKLEELEETAAAHAAKSDAPAIRLSGTHRYDFGVVSAATHKSMQGNKRRDTKPEMLVRRMLREMGYTGYRCDWKKAPGRPDVAFVGRKKAIFVMGCFWHRCPACNLSVPKKNVEYWEKKFARNIERDERNRAALEEAGWDVLMLWEHQLKKKELPATRRLLYDFVRRNGEADYDEAFPDQG